MAPESFLFHVNSRPAVSSELWKEWYLSEHLPDLINSGCSIRATLYEETSTPFNANPDHPRRFLALYQTPYAELLKADVYPKVRTTSELFARENGTKDIQDNGDFDARNYKLIQEFDPLQIGETPPPQILTVEMHPKDVDDFEKWYHEEHLDLLQKLPGYRRSLRYKLGPKSELTKGDFQPDYLAIHEINELSAFGSKEAEQANTTPWTLKHIDDSKVFIARGWKLIHSLGF